MTKALDAIQERYSDLADSCCSLSCGGAIGFANARPGEICVDLGSGRGNDVLRLAERVGPEGMAYGIDTTDAMLEKAAKTAEKLGIQNAKFIKSDLEAIALPHKHADLIISNCTINHARDKQKTWSQIFRVLKPGGRFVVSDIYSTSVVPEQYRNDPVAVAECWAGAICKDEYLLTLKEAGFSEIRILEESAPYAKGKIEVASITLSGVRPID